MGKIRCPWELCKHYDDFKKCCNCPDDIDLIGIDGVDEEGEYVEALICTNYDESKD